MKKTILTALAWLFASQSLYTAAQPEDNRRLLADTAASVRQQVTDYPEQTPEIVCSAVNSNPDRAETVIRAALEAGACRRQIPPSCGCAHSAASAAALVRGALANNINAADMAEQCLDALGTSDEAAVLAQMLRIRADETGAISKAAIREALLAQRSDLVGAVGQLVSSYPAQTPEVLCSAINMDSAQSPGFIAAARGSGACWDQVPPACACTKTDEGLVALVQGALLNDINSVDIANQCLAVVKKASTVETLLKQLLADGDRGDYEYILGITHTVLVDLGIDNAGDILVDVLVDGDFLTVEGLTEDCGEDCLRSFAETLVQNVVDTQQGGGLSGDLFGGPGSGSDSEPPLSVN